jgi:hypothetical protein
MDEYTKFVRKPFIVEAIEITTENIAEIAVWVGELREKDGKPYIFVNRNVVPGIDRVYPGYFMTRLGDNIRCYNKRVFAAQFTPATEDIETWVNYIREINNTTPEVTEAPSQESNVEVVVTNGEGV